MFIKSCEKGLITKEHIVTHMHLKLRLNGLIFQHSNNNVLTAV